MREPNTERSTEAGSLKECLAVITVLAEDVQVARRLKGSLDTEDTVELVGLKRCAVCISWG